MLEYIPDSMATNLEPNKPSPPLRPVGELDEEGQVVSNKWPAETPSKRCSRTLALCTVYCYFAGRTFTL